MPRDWDRSVKRIPGDDTIALVSRKHGSVVRSNKRRQVIFSKAAEVKYKDSSLRAETKGPDFIPVFHKPKYFAEVPVSREILHAKDEERSFNSASNVSCVSHQRGC